MEINQAEYLVRGLGYIKSVADIEDAVITSKDYTSIRIKDIANVNLGPAPRRGILDKEGAEVVGGVITARYGANPMEVINNSKEKIEQIKAGLPSKELADGTKSQLTIVPFYDRSELIQETLNTLNEALSLEILITILVIIVMVFNLRASVLISGLLPVAVLMVFISMKYFNVDANIVALSGIAIAIGTMVDIGIILTENIIRHLDQEKRRYDETGEKRPINIVVYEASAEVSGAILTAVLTTVISFIPVFTMVGAEGKLFRPLAFTKTAAIIASLLVALFFIPPFAAYLFRRRNIRKAIGNVINGILIVLGVAAIVYGYWLGLILIGFGVTALLKDEKFASKISDKVILSEKWANSINIFVSALAVVFLLAEFWRPLGLEKSIFWNLLFVGFISFGLLAIFWLFQKYYTQILGWALRNKILFLSIPALIVTLGVLIWQNTGKEFMPSLNEGSFLLMPTSMPHSGVDENKRILQQMDMAVAGIPEIKMAVGKAGRTESALDPAPLSMFENIIQYKSEYAHNEDGNRQRFKVNKDGFFVLKDGSLVNNPNRETTNRDQYEESEFADPFFVEDQDLVPDNDGEFYRNWRPEIKSPDDIWNEIVRVTRLPGLTSAPKLQPIETRLVMLQTGMRAPMGVKVKGQDLREIEDFGIELEEIIKHAEGVKVEAVFADRIVGKPYLLLDIERDRLARYGISIEDVQEILQVAVGG